MCYTFDYHITEQTINIPDIKFDTMKKLNVESFWIRTIF